MKNLALKKGEPKALGRKNNKLVKDVIANKYLYIMLIPVFMYYIIIQYIPLYGSVIAFKDYVPGLGIMGSPWVGLDNFKELFGSIYFTRLVKNTVLLSCLDILVGFPAPIILALLLNEVTHSGFKRTIQTITYMPHFISLVVIAGMIKEFTGTNGIITDLMVAFGFERTNMLLMPECFRGIYVFSGVWQQIGWGTIIYLGAISAIDPAQYEAGVIDGATRWQQLIHITLPGIASTIILLFILRVGQIMSVGWEKVILLYNPSVYETADVLSSYVYRVGLQEAQFSFSTAVGLFNSVINFFLVITANFFSRKFSENGLW